MKAKGQRVGTLPYGYTVDVDGATLIDNPEEQRITGIIRQLRRDGMTLAAIRAELQARGIRNRAGKTVWPLSTIHAIVKEAA